MKCADCLQWEAKGGTVSYCSVCKNDGRSSIPAQAHQPPADPWRNFIPAGVEPPIAVERARGLVPEPQGCGAFRREGVNTDHCLHCGSGLLAHSIEAIIAGNGWPNTDATKTPPKPAPPRSEGIARAVDRLSQHEPRLGCHAWRP